MKLVSVYNTNGDEIMVTPDMLAYYANIGWNQAEVVEEIVEESE